MKSIKGLAVAAGLAMAVAGAPGAAMAADVIVNGGFDTDLSGWTFVGLVSGTDCSFSRTTAALAGMTGGYVLADAIGGSQCGFYQDVTLAPGTTNTLTVDMGSTGSGTAPSDIHALEIRDTSNALLQSLYTRVGTDPAESITSRGPFNLDAYAGQTIRIFFYVRHQSAPYNSVFDNVVLDSAPGASPVPTLGEWAMTALGLILACAGGAIVTRRRARA